MGKILVSLLIISILFIDTQCFAQTPIQVSGPRLELQDNILHIYYGILNSDPSDKLMVSIDVANVDGDKITARTLNGDVGKNISGGNNKHIYWDLAADHISMDQGLNIQIVCIRMNLEEIETGESDISRMGAVLRSVAFPGWGLSKINPGKPHWVKGVAGYGCIAGALVLNQMAYGNYQNYLDSYDIEGRADYYDTAVKQDQISVVLGYAAVGIWITDIVWTILGSKKLSGKSSTSQVNGLSFGTDFDTNTNAPLLTARYTF